jgi:hypothetical protein
MAGVEVISRRGSHDDCRWNRTGRGVARARVDARQDDVATLYERSIVIDALANPGQMNVSWPRWISEV